MRLFSVGATQKLQDEGFTEADVDRLCNLALETPSLGLLLSLAPVKSTREHIASIYRNPLRPLA
ncbi:MAG: hypothetical protein Q4A13_08750 [Fretibacterium sp.]|uniref:hypothetical protein n=1 Tax=Fretibacterium sp. OH1220_COT-178 TaxID=2491047 RepID=UPI001F2FF77F|nr:hypothetical protein [Fretibacterium sp. OH1220_COT-178]MDO4787019.1 hypothetical protein [Fretibacterium sp.]